MVTTVHTSRVNHAPNPKITCWQIERVYIHRCVHGDTLDLRYGPQGNTVNLRLLGEFCHHTLMSLSERQQRRFKRVCWEVLGDKVKNVSSNSADSHICKLSKLF